MLRAMICLCLIPFDEKLFFLDGILVRNNFLLYIGSYSHRHTAFYLNLFEAACS